MDASRGQLTWQKNIYLCLKKYWFVEDINCLLAKENIKNISIQL